MANIEQQKNDFDKWCGQWEKAMESGVFDDAEHLPQPTQKTSDDSYFGPVHNNPTELSAHDADVKYWKSVYATGGMTGYTDPLVASDMLTEQENAAAGKTASAMAQSPNPIRAGSVGKDQDLTPQSLSLTFSEEDIETLSELKLQLSNAQAMLVAYEIEGKKTKTQEGKVATLKQKIDELSDAMCQVFPLAVMPQGD